MLPKIATEKEFNNIYLKTGKNPDGNDLFEIILGGENSSYNKYLLEKQKTYQIKNDPTPYIWRSMNDDKVRPEHQENNEETFDWNSDNIKPGEDYGCRCYAEFLDEYGNPNGKYGRIKWPEKGTESDPKPYLEPCDKNGVPLNEKQWKSLNPDEKEQRKQEELEKFKNSDTLRENIRKAQEMSDVNFIEKLWWFYTQVKGGGPWDYKHGGHPEMEHVGNFNYGATGKAAEISTKLLRRAAGWYQQQGSTYNPDFGHWWDMQHFTPETSYGDDPIDQYYINQGIHWYNNIYYGWEYIESDDDNYFYG